jgi:hypothetical protein
MTSQAFFSKHRNTTLPVGALLDGNLVQTVTGKSVPLTPALSDPNWLQKKFQQNIQRAADTVIVPYEGKEYALVADYNFAFNDPHWGNADMLGKQIGGKIGIIQDPFGKNGEPVFLGATTPIVGGAVEHLSLTADGKLYADVLVDEQTAPGVWRVYKPLFVWDAPALIQAALEAKARGQTLTTPIDRIKGITGAAGQVTAAIPQRYNGARDGEYFGWMYGIGIAPTTVNVAAQGNYGDVIGVDLIKLIAQQQLGLAPLTVKADGTTNWTIAQQQEYSALLDLLGKNLSDFNIGQDQIDPLKLDPKLPADHNKQPRMQLVLKQDGTLYSRNDAEGNLPADFKTSGVFFLAPTINGDDETALRAGKTLAAKAPVTLSFWYKEQGVEKHGIVSVTAHDYASRSNTFFGDRPLDNPGYSAFTLHGEVGVGKANDLLDVYRVEQRLKYLGFPAMGYGDPLNTAAQNKLQEFDVDGQWGSKESYASRFFYKVVSYGVNGRQLVPAGHGDNFAHADYFAALQAATASFSVSVNGKTMEYLNAYNAPHWMAIGDVAGWKNTQLLGAPSGGQENYGTSWLRDLMLAKQYGLTALGTEYSQQFNGQTLTLNPSTFKGAVDANHGFTPDIHGSHDMGMAFDLGITQYTAVGQDITTEALMAEVRDIALLDPEGAWSNRNAAALINKMKSATNNRQDLALMDFLSLYAVTQKGIAGSRDALASQINGGSDKTAILDALFGDGTQASGLINGVIIGGNSTKNTYKNIHAALQKLGFEEKPPSVNSAPSLEAMKPHHDHFHVYLQPPKAKQIEPKLLLAGAMPDSNAVQLAKTDPVKLTPAIVRKVEGSLRAVCRDLENPSYNTVQGVYIPPGIADPGRVVAYALEKLNVVTPKIIDLDKIHMVQPPTNGVLEPERLTEAHEGLPQTHYFRYIPNKGYLGADHTVFEIEIDGYKIRVGYVFQVVMPDYDPKCPAEPNGGEAAIPSVQVSIEDVVADNSTLGDGFPSLQQLAALQSYVAQFSDVTFNFIDALGNPVVLDNSLVQSVVNGNGVTLSFADLPAGALGQTTGNAITLDTTASGNGWYIDTTPGLNEEYLPTSNPNEWVAKAGSAAAGKMDMLTVLLHEYGHALGIDHNADAHDYMGTTLTAGVRRLPTPDELALMGQLVAQAKSGLASSNTQDNVPNPFPSLPLGGMGIAFAGLLQRNRYGSLNAMLNNSTITQYAVAANATLVNGNLNASSGWATQGSVNIGNGVATLSEVSTTQTRLNQVFMVNANDRYLSFTLSGTALDDLNGAPDDAFEVALLNANDGSSLLGNTGLTHSDAFLNLQGDGTEHTSSGVTRITNPDGSRTYRLDLSGVASGTAVNLSFDLIGFGQNNSHVNISDVRLSGLPQLHDDAVTLLEDGTSAKSLVIAGLSQCNRYGGLNVTL